MNGLSKYKKRVFACLTCTREEKEYCFSRIAESLGENTDCSFEELVKRFGEPEAVAASLLDNLPAENNISAISTERRNSARFKKIVFIAIAMIVFIIVFFCFWDAKTRGGDSEIEGPTIISSWEDANNTKGEN